MEIGLATLCVLLLAYANGSNDNFKGVATLFGSQTTSFKLALAWGTLTTLAGSLVAFFFAQQLLIIFSGKGLVPPEVLELKGFVVAVGCSTALTIMLATLLGFPVSTTHALTGALVGSGLVASTQGVYFNVLLSKFLVPLILSPVLAIVVTFFLYPVLRNLRKKMGIKRESCVCFGKEAIPLTTIPMGYQAQMEMLSLHSGTTVTCTDRYQGQVLGFRAGTILDVSHYISAGAVSFARGLNDTPKIAALLLAGGVFPPQLTLIAVGLLMALGGLMSGRKVAETMSKKITTMNTGQGFTANVVTAFLVIGASRMGMPVSTTHVSCGSLFGIGTVTGQAKWGTIRSVLSAWVITLPLSAVLGMGCFMLFQSVLG